MPDAPRQLGVTGQVGVLGAWGAVDSMTWGTMLYYAQNGQALTLGAWWWFIPPGLMIALLGMGLSLINFAIDEVINPRLRTAKARPAVKKEVAAA